MTRHSNESNCKTVGRTMVSAVHLNEKYFRCLKMKRTVQACFTAKISVQHWNYEGKCCLSIGGLCLKRSSMVNCADDQTGRCAPCVTKNRNRAFPFSEQLAFRVSIFVTFFQKWKRFYKWTANTIVRPTEKGSW